MHVLLIVEDDVRVAALLEEICASLGFGARHATTLEDVREAVSQGGYCGVVLDLPLPADEHARPLVATGETAVALVRKVDPRRNAEGFHVLPIVVIIAASTAPELVARLFKAGVDELIPHSFGDGAAMVFAERIDGVFDKIRACFVQSGRGDHQACAALNVAVSPTRPSQAPVRHGASPVVLELRGELAGKRTIVRVNGVRRELQARNFVVLLRLGLEHQRDRGAWSTQRELGIARNPEVPSRLREALNPAMLEGLDVVETLYGGHIRLLPSVVVEIDQVALEHHPDARVQKLLAERGSATRSASPP